MISSSQPIVLVCSADNNYAMPLAVTLRSALVNLKATQKLIVFILDGGISQRNKRRIISSLNPERVEINWVQPNAASLQNIKLTRHLTIATCYRLLIPQLLPKHVAKVIYLDADMIVTGDLEKLWNIDIGDNYVLAVQDDNQWYISMAVGLKNYQELGLNPDDKYFNAGLLVINLEKWRSDNIGKKVIEYLEKNQAYACDIDQDGLNVVLAGQWGQLDPRWNQMPRIYRYSSWEDSPYGEDAYNALLNSPYVIHFTNSPKPWQRNCEHPRQDLFFQHLDQTAWSGWRETIWRRAWRKVEKGMKKLWALGKNPKKAFAQTALS